MVWYSVIIKHSDIFTHTPFCRGGDSGDLKSDIKSELCIIGSREISFLVEVVTFGRKNENFGENKISQKVKYLKYFRIHFIKEQVKLHGNF